eukprot:COSAG04_NODE_4511_length_2045_cov_1.269784_2_plen_138_part_00
MPSEPTSLRVVALAALEQLDIGDTGCGDDGFVTLAAALPTLTHLRDLRVAHNPAAGARGWAALAGALPSLPALKEIYAAQSTGMGSEGAAALAAAAPNCPRLQGIELYDSGLDAQAKAKLLSVKCDGLRISLSPEVS